MAGRLRLHSNRKDHGADCTTDEQQINDLAAHFAALTPQDGE